MRFAVASSLRIAGLAALLCSGAIVLAIPSASLAGAPNPAGDIAPDQAPLLFDNSNPDACGLTGAATFRLDSAATVTRIDVWYHFNPDEDGVSYTLYDRGHPIEQGRLERSDCDPYQQDWCNARVVLQQRLYEGEYEVRTGRSSICQNERSGGEGVVRVYGWRIRIR